MPIYIYQYVLRFQIPVENSISMQVVQSKQSLAEVGTGVALSHLIILDMAE